MEKLNSLHAIDENVNCAMMLEKFLLFLEEIKCLLVKGIIPK